MYTTRQFTISYLARQAVNLASRKRYDRKSEKAVTKLAQAAQAAQETLFSTNTIFPFTLFPDSIMIDRDKLIIIRRSFFGVSKTVNIQLQDLLLVEADTGPFFGSLSIKTQQFTETVTRITYLTRKDTLQAQRLLQGFITAREKNIDYGDVDSKQLVRFIEEIGQAETRQ